MSNRIVVRGLAYSLAAATIFTTLATNTIQVNAAENSLNEKEEVVYIITDASGKTDSVNVVNIFGKGSVTDYGNYSQVKMLNTTDDINQSKDKISFTTDKDKVYYQGTMDNAQIPWNIDISYKLDGKAIKAEELAGKSGKLQIHISISENQKCTGDFYNQYALQASVTLDTEKCKNIVADGATMANVGSDKQISYTVLPGKGLDASISAEVEDFEMDAMAINGIKLNLDVDIDDAELMYKVKQIQDAAVRLNDGAAELSNGSSQLADGGSNLVSGSQKLNEGTVSLQDGISNLEQGVNDMQTALKTLNSKSQSLTQGSSDINDALKYIQTQLSEVSVDSGQLKTLVDSSASIKSGIEEAYKGAVELQQATSYQGYMAALKANNLDVEALNEKNTQTISSLSQQIESLQDSVNKLKSTDGYDNDDELKARVNEMEVSIKNLQDVITLLEGNNACINGTKQYFDSLSSGIGDLVKGLDELNTKYSEFDTAINQLSNTLSGMLVKVSTLKTGIDQLVVSYQTLDTGIDQYTDGVAAILASYSQIVDGTGTLASGSKSLVSGSQELRDGSASLYTGILSMDQGSKSLQEGTNEFYEQTADVDEQVQNQIDDMLDEISGGDDPVVSFASEKNTNISSLQFVIKTSAIEKAELEETNAKTAESKSFWQKLVDLF